MQIEALRHPLQEVRCLACHAVYELPQDADTGETPGCPDCGGVIWLAATIRLTESEGLREA